ncbi:hypothetical protein CYMTET_28949 [Cymbomonas tetramitiformis]|uniref:Uncharacterized protein n=1 Tax=Cymbomonas tetramitiformis TaxID=36881 RepID=A0AAE0FM33_9CHLO|nr:hypothetical protein CYMTET_28949 [Cymbomonas tetramitiformis]
MGRTATFDLAAAHGAAARDTALEAASRHDLEEQRLKRIAKESHATKQKETIRQKNKRKQGLGQANFTLKDNRDCPDVYHNS